MRWRTWLMLVIFTVGVLGAADGAAAFGDPRSMALQYAMGALVDDGTSSFSNPAGVAQLRTRELHVSYQLGGDGPATASAVYSEPDYGTGSGSLGLVRWMDSDLAQTMLFYTVAYQVQERLRLGATIRYDAKRDGYRLVSGDVGLQFETGTPVSLGLVVENPLFYEFGDTGVQLDPVLRPAVGVDLEPVALGAELYQQQFRMGAEYTVRDVSVRGGINRDFDLAETRVSFGLGFDWEEWRFDYAYGDEKHQVGLSVRF